MRFEKETKENLLGVVAFFGSMIISIVIGQFWGWLITMTIIVGGAFFLPKIK